MKKFALLCLAIVLALGALGVGYAAWTDTIYIDGTVNTGSLCLEIEDNSWGEVSGNCPPTQFAADPDQNWSGWVPQVGQVSCPDGYKFEEKFCVDKDVAYMTFNEIEDGDGNVVELEVTIHDAYPHYLGRITFEVCNCGTIPLKIKTPVITQSNFLLIEYRDNIGTQLHPGQCAEISFFVGVVQHEGYFGYASGLWIVDDESMPLTPMDSTLTFTITIEGIQWNEY